MSNLYIVRVTEDGETMVYEYSNMKHAREQYDNEEHAELVEYKDGNHYLVEAK